VGLHEVGRLLGAIDVGIELLGAEDVGLEVFGVIDVGILLGDIDIGWLLDGL